MDKKPVYNGYKEKYVTGKELKEMYENSYLGEFRHRATYIALQIPKYLEFSKIQDDTIYRIFYNEHFCRIMTGDTDKYIDFFSHATLEHIKLSKNFSSEMLELAEKCPVCGNELIVKRGRFGFFLSCDNYPSCKGSCKIPIIGSSCDFSIPPELISDNN